MTDFSPLTMSLTSFSAHSFLPSFARITPNHPHRSGAVWDVVGPVRPSRTTGEKEQLWLVCFFHAFSVFISCNRSYLSKFVYTQKKSRVSIDICTCAAPGLHFGVAPQELSSNLWVMHFAHAREIASRPIHPQKGVCGDRRFEMEHRPRSTLRRFAQVEFHGNHAP